MDENTEHLSDGLRSKLALKLSSLGICDYTFPPKPSVYVSPMWAQILGYSSSQIPCPDDFLSWWQEQLHPNDREHVLGLFQRLYSGEETRLVCHFSIRHKDGHWVDVEAQANVLDRNENGQALHVFSVMRDLTRGENYYQQIVDSIHEGIWVIDKHNNTQYVNPRMASMLAYEIEELHAQPITQFMNQRSIKKYNTSIHKKL